MPDRCKCRLCSEMSATFIPVLGRGNDDAILQAEAGLCRRYGPDIELASGKAAQIVRAVWPGLADSEYGLKATTAAPSCSGREAPSRPHSHRQKRCRAG